MNILVAARLNSEYKLKMTLDPVIHLDFVDRILLVRRYPVDLPKTVCYCPPGILKKFILTTELYRLWMIFYLCWTRKADCLLGIHFIFHCVYTALAKMVFRLPLMMLIIESPDKYNRNAVFKYFLQKADLIGVRGNHSKQHIIGLGIDDDKVFITPDIHEFSVQKEPAVKVKKYDLIFVGYHTQAKRLDILMDVMDQVRKKIPQVKLALIGDGPLRDMAVAKIYMLGLNDHVEQIGFVESIDPYLEQSKIFIMTSQTEGLPTVLLEAMAFGLPFIVPDVGDITDLAVDGYNALVVKPLDVGQFSEACIKLLTDQALYDRLAENSRTMFSEKQKDHTAVHVRNLWRNRLEILQKK
ncbi:MAG: glycosyltransferase family 4 protein [Candidatus Omnitrophota bacterium]